MRGGWVWLLVLALVSTACAGSSGEGAAASTDTEPSAVETADEPTDASESTEPDITDEEESGPSPEPAETATPEPTQAPVEVSAEEFEAAAVTAFEADPQGLFAWDVLEAELQGTRGLVFIDLCGWDGLSVDDDVFQAAYRVRANDTGEITTTFESFNTRFGDCTNTELIESALQATRDYDNYWAPVLADPASFDLEEASQVMTTGLAALQADFSAERAADGLALLNTDLDGNLPDSSVQPALTRMFVADDGIPVREILGCRPLPENYGLYRGDLLIDDFRDEGSTTTEAIFEYQMIRNERGWLVSGTETRVQSDCTGFGDRWLGGINEALGEPAPWEVIAR